MKLTHINSNGEAVMVDVGGKVATVREAVAEGTVKMSKSTLSTVVEFGVKKGDVLGVARVAAIMAAKNTSAIIPLCHPLPISSVSVEFDIDRKKSTILARCTAKVTGATGVEMEAMTGASVACLTIYDMCKGLDKSIEITGIRLIMKSGGKSGLFTRKGG